jgi:hypothetical protein
MQTQLLIGGRLVAGEGAVESLNTGKPLGCVLSDEMPAARTCRSTHWRITRWCGTSW